MIPKCFLNDGLLALDMMAMKAHAVADNAGLLLWLALMDGDRACVLGMMVEV